MASIDVPAITCKIVAQQQVISFTPLGKHCLLMSTEEQKKIAACITSLMSANPSKARLICDPGSQHAVCLIFPVYVMFKNSCTFYYRAP